MNHKKRKSTTNLLTFVSACVCVFAYVCMFESMWGPEDNLPPAIPFYLFCFGFDTGFLTDLERPLSPRDLPVPSLSVLRLQVQAAIPSFATLLGVLHRGTKYSIHVPMEDTSHSNHQTSLSVIDQGRPRGTPNELSSLVLVPS